MSNFKFSPNLFLEVEELERYKSFLDIEGFRKNLLQNTISYGLIKKNNDLPFLNGKVERDLDTSVGQRTIKIRALQAIDNSGKFLSSPEINSVPIPADDKWYWIKIAHNYNSTEIGKVTLAINGDLTGVGTKFTEVLRGMPNFPARIRFNNSQYNTLEYDVLEVIDDEHAIIVHPASSGAGVATFEIESELTYAVVGTFTPGVAIPNEDKYPFQYDSISYEVVEEIVDNQRPTFEQDKEFYLARLKIFDGDIVIQDKRIDIWTSQGKYVSQELEDLPNPLIGIECIKWQNLLAPSNENEVSVAWGMRSQNWAVDSSKNILTLFGSAAGGVFKNVDNFTDGDFDGWRVYNQNGTYSRVSTSIKQGSAINLTLDVLDVDNYSSDGGVTFNNSGINAEWVLVVPNCEEVEIQFTAESTNNNSSRTFAFPVNTLIAKCIVEVYLDPSCLFNVTYRYKTDRTYSPYRILPSDPVGYYTEESFQTSGIIKPTDDRVLHPYVSIEGSGYIQLLLSPNAYSILVDKVYKGDRIGVETRTVLDPGIAYELRVGQDKQYQFITGNISLTDDISINLSSAGAKEGNEFRIQIDCEELLMNGHKILITRNHDIGSPATIKEITQADIYHMMNQEGGIVMNFLYSDLLLWNVSYQNYDLGAPNKIITLDGVIDNLFDSTGLGKIRGVFGHAICDGRLAPDLVNRFILGAGISDTDATVVAVGAEGGQETVTLTVPQLPSHQHLNGMSDDITTAFVYGSTTEGMPGASTTDIDTGGSTNAYQGKTSSVGEGEGHENMPPYYALIYAKKLY